MWWQYVIAAVVVIFAVWGFVSVVRLQTHRLSDRTDNTAEDVYDRYADSQRSSASTRKSTVANGGMRK